MNARDVLVAVHPAALVDPVLAAYTEIERAYTTQHWKLSELDAGHFVESVRRLLENILCPPYTPIGTDLPKFNESVLGKYASTTPTADEGYRLLIPRALWAIYAVRSKRGIGHVGKVNANEMDATLILYTSKWVLAELVRLSAGVSTTDAQALVDKIVERQLDILWKHDGGAVILDETMEVRDQVLVYLYDRDLQSETALQKATRYVNVTNFRKVLARLHHKRLILRHDDGTCQLTSKGRVEAERIIRHADLAK